MCGLWPCDQGPHILKSATTMHMQSVEFNSSAVATGREGPQRAVHTTAMLKKLMVIPSTVKAASDD